MGAGVGVQVLETLLGKQKMRLAVSPMSFLFLLGLRWTWSIMRFSTKKSECVQTTENMQLIFLLKIMYWTAIIRVDFQESAGGYFLCGRRGFPRLCHYKKVVNSVVEPAGPSGVTKMAWVTKWSGTQIQFWRRAGVKFPSGLSPWLSALGADNLHQGGCKWTCKLQSSGGTCNQVGRR